MPTSLLVAHYHKDLAPGRLVEIFDSQEVNVQVESRRSIPDHASSSSCRYQPVSPVKSRSVRGQAPELAPLWLSGQSLAS